MIYPRFEKLNPIEFENILHQRKEDEGHYSSVRKINLRLRHTMMTYDMQGEMIYPLFEKLTSEFEIHSASREEEECGIIAERNINHRYMSYV
ncbi:hypothetical protein AVEN_154376-1 [Araneus ventricosus]|uniref:Uncharacterized protein n=1 Tax=Araneus ventricosus TaxID=182803 RepID=A0A4Y2WET2_ARAVE|nr:hypothetical protein AVEN_154376-1 [Araneus ventricosus]